jgi:phosphoserine aminotransferase
MLVLSPRAVARLENYKPAWPLPKIFRMTKGGKLMEDLFEGATINTPSMLCVEDCLDALQWAKSIGSLPALIKRCQSNFDVMNTWVKQSAWVDFLADDPHIRSITSVCFKVKDPWFLNKDKDAQEALLKALAKMLDDENVAKDIGSYRDAPAGLRIWGGATVESSDIEALLPWIDYAYATLKGQS